MIKRFLKILIGKLIEKLEYFLWKDCVVIDNKFISTQSINTIVKTPKGYSESPFIHRTIPYSVWNIKLENGIVIECADTHTFVVSGKEVQTYELKIGDELETIDGIKKVLSIEKLPYKLSMYDIFVNDEEHLYYTNNIISHNTISSSIYLAWFILFNYDKTVFLCGNIEKTAVDILGKVVEVIKNVPFYMKPGVIKNSSLEWKFDNGCRLMGAATTKRAGIGFTIHCLYLDEFAHVDKGIIDEFFDNIYPTVSSLPDSKIIVTSTPNGMNRFYQIYDAATKGINLFKPFRIDWWQVPDWNKEEKRWVLRDKDWADKQIAQLGSGDVDLGRERFGMQYGNSFLSTGNLLLGPAALKRIETTREYFENKPIRILEDLDIDDVTHIKWKNDFNPNEVKYSNELFLFSIDIAEGNGGDNSVLNIFKIKLIDREDWKYIKNPDNPRDFVGIEQVGIFAYNRISIQQFAKLIYSLSHLVFNIENVKLLIEWNTFGGEMFLSLKNVFGERNDFDTSSILKYIRSADKIKPELGLKLNKDNKLIYAQSTKKYIGNGRIILHDNDTIEEFNLFGRRGYSWAAITGNDDRAMTCVNASSFFENRDFIWIADIILEQYPNEFKDILSILNNNVTDDLNHNSIWSMFK